MPEFNYYNPDGMHKFISRKFELISGESISRELISRELISKDDPVPPFLLAQTLSSKQIGPTDNMWPKSDNAKKHNWWLKG